MSMRRTLVLPLAALLATVMVTASCQPPKPPAPKLDTDDSKAIYALGLIIAERLDQFQLNEQELALFEEGLRDGVLKQDKKVDPKTLGKELQAFSKARQMAAAEKEKTDSAAYLDKMAAEPGATKGATGYVIRTLTEGTGPTPTADDTVKVNYHGTLRDGTVFDSSVERGEPAEFPLGHVIPCWTQSLQQMKVGGKYKVTCPSDIAYGDRGSPPAIRPGAALTFEIELLEIKPPAPPPAPAPAPAPAAKPAPHKKGK
ncbi:MAG TPA: FKBP-type peptidyl-prolyl cis-trans isomerase [Myxococcota bacterium]|nr:FKBP-type peptidyl-prolyl cis-trans isomerase [Myxococcota bacterium]